MDRFAALQLLYWLATFGCVAFAMLRGGSAEKMGALVVALASISTLSISNLGLLEWRTSRTALVIVDLAVFVAFLALATRSNRFWPLWASAFQLIAVSTHFVMLIEPRRVLQAYALAQGFWAYPMLAAIAIGTHGHRQRMRARMAGRM